MWFQHIFCYITPYERKREERKYKSKVIANEPLQSSMFSYKHWHKLPFVKCFYESCFAKCVQSFNSLQSNVIIVHWYERRRKTDVFGSVSEKYNQLRRQQQHGKPSEEQQINKWNDRQHLHFGDASEIAHVVNGTQRTLFYASTL